MSEEQSTSSSFIQLYNSIDYQNLFYVLSNCSVNEVVRKELYDASPEISHKLWKLVGDHCSAIERKDNMIVQPNKAYTLRLDIRGMSTLRKIYANLNIMKSGFDEGFAKLMVDVTLRLAKEFHAHVSFTQSDEITLIINPRLMSPRSYLHLFAGKRDKLVSLAASLATAVANKSLYSMCNNEVNYTEVPSIQFDCRFGVWDSLQDALILVIWRAQDCTVNGVSDAIHSIDKKMSNHNTIDKLRFLEEQGKLPLPPHQAYGTLVMMSQIKTVKHNAYKQTSIIEDKNSFDIVGEGSNVINTLIKLNFCTENTTI